MTQKVLKQMYQLLLTEPHAPTVCAKLEAIAREALAQPEQEPVAWGVFEGNLHDMFFTEAEAVQMADLKGTHAEVRPLYTTPPQRTQPNDIDLFWRAATTPEKWVGLTNNELQPIADEYRILFGSWVEDFARAIEAKLKEKNT